VRNQIGAQGITFTHDFVPLSLCCPSRASILTGQYAHNHRVLTNSLPEGGFERFAALGLERATIGTALHDAGYRTGFLGKYLNEYPQVAKGGGDPAHIPPGWDEWTVPFDGAAYKELDYTLNQNGKLIPHGHAPEDYLTDVLTERARRFLWQASAGPAPFFLVIAPYAPHRPATPAPRHAQLFPNAKAPRTPSFNKAGNLPPLTDEQIGLLDYQYRHRLQSLQAVNDLVAGLLRTLRKTGRLDNTYVFFTSDNGFHLGQHRMKAGKYTPYEEDIRVPLLVRGPGVPAGQTVSAFVLNVDFAPTFAELGRATLGLPADGRSLVPLLHGGPAPADWRRLVFLEQFAFREPARDAESTLEPTEGEGQYASHAGFRTPGFKYIEHGNQEREVYDLVHDPAELDNLAGRIAPQSLDRLSAIVKALSTCAGESCRRIESTPVDAPPLPNVR
jgi:arylsulfatase A-like enzyme